MGLYNLSLDCDCCEEPPLPLEPAPYADHLVVANWRRNSEPPTWTFKGNFAWQDSEVIQQEDAIKSKLFPPDGTNPATRSEYFTPDRDENHLSKDCSMWVNPGHPNPLLKPSCGSENLLDFPLGEPKCRFVINYPSNASTPRTPRREEFLEPGSCWFPASLGSYGISILPLFPSFAVFSLSTTGNCGSPNGQVFGAGDPRSVRHNRAGRRVGWEWDINPPATSSSLWDVMISGMSPTPTKAILPFKVRREFAICVAQGTTATGGWSWMLAPPDGPGPSVSLNFKVSLSARAYPTDLEFARALHAAKIEDDDLWSNDTTLLLPGTAKPTAGGPAPDWSTAQVSSVETFEDEVDVTEALKSVNTTSQVLGVHCGIKIGGDGFAPSLTTCGLYRRNWKGEPLNPNLLQTGGWASHARVDAWATGPLLFVV